MIVNALQRTDARSEQIVRSGVAVIVVKLVLIGRIDRSRGVICRAVLDLLTIDIEVHQLIRPIDFSYRPWRDQNLLPGPPVLRIDDEVMDAPIGILHEEILDVTDLAV